MTKANNSHPSKTEHSSSSPSTQKDELPLTLSVLVHFEAVLLLVLGHLRDFLRHWGIYRTRIAKEKWRTDYVPLYDGVENFFANNIYRRVVMCFNHPITSVPGAEVDVLEQKTDDYGWTVKCTNNVKRMVNLGSYNYLGFAQNEGPCAIAAEEALLECGHNSGSPRCELGTFKIIQDLEETMARFLSVEDCLVFGMGFATNSMNIPALVGPGCLILSDELNHASIVLGCRLSGAKVKAFRHADMKDLERLLNDAIAYGQPRTHIRWKKVLIVVEGIYSMEGSIVDLPTLIKLKKKYKTYLYLDEAHSIGAMGASGKGIIEYYGCDPNDVDIMMGTFTKSFGAAGGYIAGKKNLVNHLRCQSHSHCYAVSMSPPVAAQIKAVLNILMGEDGSSDGQNRIRQLAENTIYFRRKLKENGFTVYGDDHSPVVPVMLYNYCKLFVWHELAKRGVATVVVGFPATPPGKARVRFCLSGAHTKDMLDKVLTAMDEVGERMKIKYSKK